MTNSLSALGKGHRCFDCIVCVCVCVFTLTRSRLKQLLFSGSASLVHLGADRQSPDEQTGSRIKPQITESTNAISVVTLKEIKYKLLLKGSSQTQKTLYLVLAPMTTKQQTD